MWSKLLSKGASDALRWTMIGYLENKDFPFL